MKKFLTFLLFLAAPLASQAQDVKYAFASGISIEEAQCICGRFPILKIKTDEEVIIADRLCGLKLTKEQPPLSTEKSQDQDQPTMPAIEKQQGRLFVSPSTPSGAGRIVIGNNIDFGKGTPQIGSLRILRPDGNNVIFHSQGLPDISQVSYIDPIQPGINISDQFEPTTPEKLSPKIPQEKEQQELDQKILDKIADLLKLCSS